MQSPVRAVVLHLLAASFCLGTLPVFAAAPRLKNVTITPVIGEHSTAILTGRIVDPDPGNTFKLTVTWGDGTKKQVFNGAAGTTRFSIAHSYHDDILTNTASDTLLVSLKLQDSTGLKFLTNTQITITNVPPQVALSPAVSPDGSPSQFGLELTEFLVPTPSSHPWYITVGPDNALWFTETAGGKIGRITTDGVFTEFPVTNALSPLGITAGTDGRLYFCSFGNGKIGRITTNGAVKMFTIPRAANTPPKLPWAITRGPTPNTLWFTLWGLNIGRFITTNGAIKEFKNPPDVINPEGIALGPDGNIWFTDWGNDRIARRELATGVTTTFPLSLLDTPHAITAGPDLAMWFTSYQNGYVGRITSDGNIIRFQTGDNLPWGITTGPYGAMWFLEGRPTNCNIVRMELGGALRRFALAPHSDPREMVTGPDNALWFTIPGRNRIGRMRYTTAGNVVLHGQIIEPGFTDPHLVHIDWGDGSAVEVLDLQPGIHTFSIPHTYALGAQYSINVTVFDDDLGQGSAQSGVTVPDLIPP
jgi:virginiamycin B lyase